MVVDPATGEPLFAGAEEARDALSREQKNALTEAYIEHERGFSPAERNMWNAEFGTLLDEVKKLARRCRRN